jgi:flagellin
MTRVNTNVSSLTAQNRLQKTQVDLQTSLTRLSTGLRINSGKDDPAGLIASESLRSDITSINKALSNTQRANQIIGTADSALGQVSSLLNDIRGLVTEAANNGALSDNEIAANQLQVDSSLEAINRISQTTTFQGRRLLDGSLDFQTTAGTNFNKISDFSIDQANLGSTGSVSIDTSIQTAASKAQIDLSGIPVSTAAANAFANFSLGHAQTNATGGVLTVDGQTVNLAASSGAAVGAEGNGVKNVSITYGVVGATADTSTYNATTNTLSVNLSAASGVATSTNLQTAINAGSGFTASGAAGAATLTSTSASSTALAGGRDAGSATLRVLSNTAGSAANAINVSFVESGTAPANSVSSALTGNNLVVTLNGAVSYASIVSNINSSVPGYTASLTGSTGDQNYDTILDAPPAAANLASGSDSTGGISADVVFSLSGKTGSQVFNFKAGTTIDQLKDAVNLLKDSTGVSASVDITNPAAPIFSFKSDDYGSKATVNINVISEGSGGSIISALGGSKKRDNGTDIVATVNGIRANSDGNSISINTSTLTFKASIEAGFTGTSNFSITGGGAQFQLGPDVVSAQQARLGITSVNTGSLGGTSGRLYQLGSGESRSLKTDATGAAKIINDVIEKVTSLRGRLGAFQRTTLDSNTASLNDTLLNLNEAQSSIRDADFAKESANLTRAQILVQSGTSVLGIANQSSQSVLSLLR